MALTISIHTGDQSSQAKCSSNKKGGWLWDRRIDGTQLSARKRNRFHCCAYGLIEQSKHAAVIIPSHGRFVGASSLPFSEYRRRPGDRVGLNWRIPNVHGKRAIRHVVYDTNWWKSFINARLRVSMGDRGCLSLFGTNAETHRMFAEHLTSEYFIKTEARGRSVDEWKQRPEQPDNHWFDCLIGSAVAASLQGALLFGTDLPSTAKPARTSFKNLQRSKKS
ncbi:MAG: phage terminase large subunit family protein [Planctomycetota bacterium]|nr:phage terminase large subunit family protein [Planctomycetota bacterium]